MQLRELDAVIAERLQRLQEEAGLVALPRMLVFHSAVDSMVSPARVVDGMLRRLKPHGHELVLFDRNHHAKVAPLLEIPSDEWVRRLMADGGLPFDLTLLTNESNEAAAVVARRKSIGDVRIREQALGLTWPHDVYSLSPAGMPFPADDPVYGALSPADERLLTLGSMELRGDTGILAVPAPHLNRLRYNPFFTYLEHRVIRFLTDIAAVR